MKPLIVCLDRLTLPQALPAPEAAHEWRDYPATRPDQVVEHLRGATIAISNKVALGREQLQQLPQLKLIAVAATGYNIIDIDACRELGISVCNVPAYSTQGVAEHALMLMLMLRHRLNEYQQASRQWAGSDIFCVLGSAVQELHGATLTLIGSGHTGSRVAELAAAFGMRVLKAERRGAEQMRPGFTEFGHALAAADIVSLHCPLMPETRGMIGASQLALLKPGALLINTARGGLVDENALAMSLQQGHLGGAALDVLEIEPPPADHPLLLLAHTNLIITPHIAWASAPSLQRMGNILQSNLDSFLAGQLQNRVV